MLPNITGAPLMTFGEDDMLPFLLKISYSFSLPTLQDGLTYSYMEIDTIGPPAFGDSRHSVAII